ncbi:hypothetical protein ESCO_000200 [Escovopsis weberi]|uniref:Uncharacterized protein n=1 Tax=Escovopsis weberi TaxID=150374 RepID=A0A0M8N2R3_ESCWE|nr:hypothetical protein ESCO_000200 [Escovopsis weberi]
MPAGSGEKSQQPKGSGFPASSLYPNKNIWNSSYTASRDRSIGVKDADENPTGSSALNANSEADVWGPITWNPENPPRSVNNSPGRPREPGLSSNPSIYDHHAAIGTKKAVFGGHNFPDDADPYSLSYVKGGRVSGDHWGFCTTS